MRAPGFFIYRDHAGVVNHFRHDHHVAGALQDLIRVVVSGGEHPPGDAARDAAVPNAHVLVGIADVRQVVIALGLGGRLHGNFSIRRIHHQRSLPRANHLGARIEPDLVVGAHVARGGRTIDLALSRLLLELRGFLLCQERFPGQLRGTFEGRDGGVGPDSLQVRLPVGGARRGPFFERGFDCAETIETEIARTTAARMNTLKPPKCYGLRDAR